MEAISGVCHFITPKFLVVSIITWQITVPRDSGTCTHCPMECRIDDVSEEPFGDVITDKKDVELVLRRAQAAILNPHVSRDELFSMDETSLKSLVSTAEIAFSRNVVCVDLEGPALTDIMFLDLPGNIFIFISTIIS